MSLCPSCQVEISEQAFFCKHCGKQARCKAQGCQQILEGNAKFCSACGVGVGDIIENADAAGLHTPQPSNSASSAINLIKFDETTKSRSFEGRLTNEAIEYLSDALAQYTGGSINGSRANKPKSIPERLHPQLPGTEEVEASEAELVTPIGATASTDVSVDAAATDVQNLKQIFRLSGEKLQLEENHLKATSQLDYARRLTFLFLYAQQQLRSIEHTPRADLTAILTEEKVYDGNTRNWINNSDDLKVEGDTVRLVAEGRRLAKKYLSEVVDDSIEKGWMPGNSGQHRSRSNHSTEKAPADKSKGVHTDVADWVAKWRTLNLDINGIEVTKERTAGEKAIFGLWAICKAVSDKQKVVSRDKIADFLKLAFNIRVAKGGSLDEAMASPTVKDKINKVPGGYQLLPPHLEYGAEIAGVSPKNSGNQSKAPQKK